MREIPDGVSLKYRNGFVKEKSWKYSTSAYLSIESTDMANENQTEDLIRPHLDTQSILRHQLVASFHDGNVHGDFETVFTGIPPELRGIQPPAQPFTLWRILEHVRLCVLDFLDYCRVPGYVELPFPAGYWPGQDAPSSEVAWQASIAEVQSSMQALEQLILSPSTDLFSPIPGGDGRTILRQALACLDHNAYHLGEAVLLRRLLGIWKTS